MFISIILFTAVLTLLSYIFRWYRKRLNYWQNLGIPCDPPHWIWGSFYGGMSKYSFADICNNYYRKYKGTGPFAGFYLSSKATVLALDPKLIQQILIKDFSNFTDHGFYNNEEDDPLSGQLFLLDGLKWHNMRNKLSPTFTSGKMKLMFPIIIDIAGQFMQVMATELSSNDSLVEVKDLLARFTTDVIGTCAFGIDCNSLQEPNTKFREIGKRAIKEQRHGMLITVLAQNFPKIAKKLHVKTIPQDIEDFYIGLVRQTVKYREENNVRRNDFMDTLIDLKNKKLIQAEHGEDLKNLTVEEISAQAFVFFNAGFETSSTTMAFALYELARNEKIQERARQEITEVMERHGNEFSYECMKQMKYLEQIIKETLRMYTVLPILSRIALEDYIVPGYPNYVIRKGMNVSIPACSIHCDPEYYPNPEQFNPDNFAADMVLQRDPCLWLPFGEGPRNCIGMRFGKMQTVIGLAMLLKNFRFSTCQQTPIPMTYDKTSFMLTSEKGIVLKVEKIEKK